MVEFAGKSLLAGVVLMGAAVLPAVAQAGTLTVYTALEEDEIADYVAAAKKDLPDIDLKVLRSMIARWVGQPSRLAELPLYDEASINSRFGGDEELKEVALTAFRNTTPALLGKLKAAIEAGDRAKAQLFAHSAKGAGAMIAAERYSGIAAAIEERAATAPLEDLQRLQQELQAAFDQFLALSAA